MFDYYKINTMGLPKCTKSTLLLTDANSECNYFCKIITLCLTSCRQIDYLISSSIQNSINEQRNKNKEKRTKNFFLSSIDVLLGFNLKMLRS